MRVETIPVAPPPVTNGCCVNEDSVEGALAIENAADADDGRWVASLPKDATSRWLPGAVESGTGRVTRPSAPVIPIAAEPPMPIVTVLPPRGAPPAAVSAAVTAGLSPNVPLEGGETSASDVAAAGAAPSL